MTKFWPSDISISDTQSPKEILEVAQEDWRTNSEGIMELALQDAVSKSGNSMIIVHAKHMPSNRTSRLLTVIHRPNNPYPVTIEPEDEELPTFLKKSYFSPLLNLTSRNMADNFANAPEREMTNPWVSETPAEFREKLAEAFNLGFVKGKILNLASGASNVLDASDNANEESQESSVET